MSCTSVGVGIDCTHRRWHPRVSGYMHEQLGYNIRHKVQRLVGALSYTRRRMSGVLLGGLRCDISGER